MNLRTRRFLKLNSVRELVLTTIDGVSGQTERPLTPSEEIFIWHQARIGSLPVQLGG